MSTAPIEQRIAAAHDFDGLCGLTIVPFGVYLLLVQLLPDSTGTTLALLLACTAASTFLQRGYRRRYGVREDGPADPERESALGLVVYLLVGTAVVALVVSLPDDSILLPLLGSTVTAGALAVLVWRKLRHIGTTWVHAVAVAVVGLSGLVPPVGRWDHTGLIALAAAAAIIVIGLHDHARLVHLLGKGTDTHE